MVEKETTFTLLQLVALVLPAVAIYLEILSSRHDLTDMDDGLAANYHAIRLTFIYLLVAAATLVLSLTSPVLRSLVGPSAASTWEVLLTGVAIGMILLALVTFGLPVAFSIVGLSDSRSIWWPYRNAKHRYLDPLVGRRRTSPPPGDADRDDEGDVGSDEEPDTAESAST